MVTRGYGGLKRLQVITWGYRGSGGYRGDKGLQGVIGGYMGL